MAAVYKSCGEIYRRLRKRREYFEYRAARAAKGDNMTRAEYMEKLAKELKAYDEDFAMDIMEDYRRHFDEAASDGRSEEAVCEELGSVEDFIKDIPEEFKKSAAFNESSTDGTANNIGKTEGTYTYSNGTGSQDTSGSGAGSADAYSDDTAGRETESPDADDDMNDSDNDFTDDFGRIAKEFGRFVNAAGKVAGKAARKAVKGADEAFNKLGEVITVKLNGKEDSNVDVHINFGDEEDDEDDDKVVDDYSDYLNPHDDDDDDEADRTEDTAYTERVKPIVYTGIDTLKMELVYPAIEIRQGASEELTVTMSRPLTQKERLYMNTVVSVDGGTLTIKQENKANMPFKVSINAPLTYYVTLPDSFDRVKASTVSGSISTADTLRVRKCCLSTVSGSIKTAAPVFADKIDLSSVSGSIKVDERLSAGTVRLHSVSGSIKGIIFGEDFEADTVSGSVKLGIASACKGKINTVSGSVKIKLMNDIGLDIKSSGMSGSMKLITDKHVEWNKGEKNTVHFGFNNSSRSAFFGDGGVKLTTSSVSGSVKVYDFDQDE